MGRLAMGRRGGQPAPALAGKTQFTTLPPLFGGNVKLEGVSPYRSFGTNTATQNFSGNYINPFASSSSATPAPNGMALQVVGDNFETYARLNGIGGYPADGAGGDGATNFKVVSDSANPSLKRLWFRCQFDDQRAAGSAGRTQRKMMIRHGDSGADQGNGLGMIQPLSTWRMTAFAFRFPAATLAILRRFEWTTMWQTKSDGHIQPGLSLCVAGRTYVPGGSGLSAGAPGTGPRWVLRTYDSSVPVATGYQLMQADIQADTWYYFIERTMHGYSGGGHTTPSNHWWVAAGETAPHSKKVNGTTWVNVQGTGAPDPTVSYGWYGFDDDSTVANDVNTYPTTNPAWFSGDEVVVEMKDFAPATQARADIAPTEAEIAHWFAIMRQR